MNDNRGTLDAITLVRRRGYNRLPVYSGNISNIVGIVTLTTWDLMDLELSARSVEDLITPRINNRWLMLEISGNKLMSRDMTIYRPTVDQQKLWNAPKSGIVADWLKIVGPEGDKALSVIQKYNK